MELAFTPIQIASIVDARATRGNTTEPIRRIAALSSARPGDVSFLGNLKYKAEVAASSASVVLLPANYLGEPQAGQLFLIVDNPSVGLARLCAHVEKLLWPKPAPGIHPSAIVSPEARVAPSATVGPLCVIEAGAVVGEHSHLQARVFVGRGARIGAECWFMPGVTLAADCIVKNRVRLQPGAIIGSDGFGYELIEGRHEKVPQVGRVVIEDDVEIGANTTLDRARFSETVVGEGTKIDNLVQVGHNVIIGKHCLVCAQAGISGSTIVEDYVIIGGQAGLAGHITIGQGAKIDGQTGVNADLEANAFVKGSPCLPYTLEQRVNVLRKRLPDLFRRVGEIETQVKNLSASS